MSLVKALNNIRSSKVSAELNVYGDILQTREETHLRNFINSGETSFSRSFGDLTGIAVFPLSFHVV